MGGAEHRMAMAKVSPKYARRHGLSSNHHARVWCYCMDNPVFPPGAFSLRGREGVDDPRRLGSFDHIEIVDLRTPGSAHAAWRRHVEESTMSNRLKHIKDEVRAAEAAGWTVDLTKNSHVRFRSPDGVATIITGSTPSDHRALKNLRADLRRAGLDV